VILRVAVSMAVIVAVTFAVPVAVVCPSVRVTSIFMSGWLCAMAGAASSNATGITSCFHILPAQG
jgi:hypothetical protein